MHFRLIAVGRLRDPAIAALCDESIKRLRPYHRLEIVEVRPGTIDDEAAAVLRAIEPGELVWLLDPGGKEISSEELAQRLERLPVEGTSRIAFVVAGTYGAGSRLVERADFRWSLSQLTFLHEWARAIVLEQLYRAAKIARNEPYHH